MKSFINFLSIHSHCNSSFPQVNEKQKSEIRRKVEKYLLGVISSDDCKAKFFFLFFYFLVFTPLLTRPIERVGFARGKLFSPSARSTRYPSITRPLDKLGAGKVSTGSTQGSRQASSGQVIGIHSVKMYFFLFTFYFFLLFSGCASLKYPSSYPMTREIVRSLQGGITVQVPQGWFNSTDANVSPGLLLWLVKKDYTAAITLTELHIDEIGSKQVIIDGLETLASISFSLKKERVQEGIQLIGTYEIFTLGGKKYCAYEYSTDQGKTIERVIVFGGVGKWFELSAVPFQKRGRFIDHESLFSVQNSLLNSLRF